MRYHCVGQHSENGRRLGKDIWLQMLESMKRIYYLARRAWSDIASKRGFFAGLDRSRKAKKVPVKWGPEEFEKNLQNCGSMSQ